MVSIKVLKVKYLFLSWRAVFLLVPYFWETGFMNTVFTRNIAHIETTSMPVHTPMRNRSELSVQKMPMPKYMPRICTRRIYKMVSTEHRLRLCVVDEPVSMLSESAYH